MFIKKEESNWIPLFLTELLTLTKQLQGLKNYCSLQVKPKNALALTYF
jgi:hypothetical protein